MREGCAERVRKRLTESEKRLRRRVGITSVLRRYRIGPARVNGLAAGKTKGARLWHAPFKWITVTNAATPRAARSALHAIPEAFHGGKEALALGVVVLGERVEFAQEFFLAAGQVHRRFHGQFDEHVTIAAAT